MMRAAVLLALVALVASVEEKKEPIPFPHILNASYPDGDEGDRGGFFPIEEGQDPLQIVAELPEVPGNIDVCDDGRIFFTYHPAGTPDPALGQIQELPQSPSKTDPTTMPEPKPWPSLELQKELVTVLSIRCSSNLLWALDWGNHGEKTPALMAYDLETGKLHLRYEFPEEVAGKGSMLNDMAFSPEENFLFIADASIVAGTPAIIIYDVEKNTARRVLHDHPSVKAKSAKAMVNDKAIEFPWPVGVDSIAVGKTHLYYAAIYDTKLWRLSLSDLMTAAIVDPASKDAELKPEAFAVKTASDGIIVSRGRIYLTDFEHSSITVMDERDGSNLSLMVQEESLLRWPDGLSVWKNELYLTASAIQLILKGDHKKAGAPFHILKTGLPKKPPSTLKTSADEL